MTNDTTKKLRREVEILKAQLAGEDKRSKAEPKESEKIKEEPEGGFSTGQSPSDEHVQQDLKRSLIITAGILILITALYFTQPHWPQF